MPGKRRVLRSTLVQHPSALAAITTSGGVRTLPAFTRIALIALACCLFAPAARAQCPENFGVVGIPCPNAPFTSTQPTLTFTGPGCFNDFGSVTYDLTQGTVLVKSVSHADYGFDSWCRTTDEFFIDGPPSGTPLSLSAILTADMSARSFAHFVAQTDSASTSGLPHEVLRLSLLELPGEHFTLSMYVYADALLSRGSASCTLVFSQLPAGYTLRSCQGYAAAPVATRPMTWGRLKASYR